ncbi:hypothetical protein INT48_001303 [Thamnidium elegans]|uniref:Reverse transcriptase domain-containing protein n=1 Tax=Thamnidium elegans TaxID=101142 RepID=A0A8H7VZ88_9FUNG|nr:hypothetical protein INT48_001303 [Thamnidium elegans]
MSNSQQSVSAPVSPNNQESVSEPNSPLSEFQPMEEVSVGLAPGVPEDLKETAQANLINLKNQYSIVYGHYLSYHKVQPDSDNARNAFAICKEAEKQYLEAKNAFAILKSIHEPVKMQDEKKFSLVPSILEAHSLNMDDHWERLLPVSLNKEERSWFNEKLRNKALSWTEARDKILDHFDTPYRKFLLMVKVWTLKQQSGELTRVFAAKFQNLRRQADLHDGLQLVFCFWCALREPVRRVASVAVSSQYGSKLPTKIEAMIDLGNNEHYTRKRSSQSFSPAACDYCNEPWFHGHRCEAFVKAKKLKVSRMARRSETTHYGGTYGTILDVVTISSAIRRMAHLALDFNKNNQYKYFIKLADNDVYTKRIGTCTLTVSCNNKTLKKEFEVMNLTDDNNEFSISIGTDYMSLLGMGIYGLPISYDDHDSTQDVIEADRRYNNKSELLEAIDAENTARENCPACEPKEYNAAMEFINKYIKQNQSIPKGVFCTVPESVVCLDTPTDVTAYKKPYPIAIKMHKVIDDQIAEWIDLGIVKRAPANTEWNTPLTVVKKTDGKGNITGYRVCHDPRHINALLKTVDRMPLPIISELFEDLKGASVYSTLDLKSAFNSLKLNPSDCHKLAFTWKGVQYQPIGTVFGIRHVSSQFQRTMSIILDGLPSVRYFVDGIVCASHSVEEHRGRFLVTVNNY